jgi:predicted secreted hydrolase
VKHGEQCYSIKTADGDYRSYYYSPPFIDVQATMTHGGEQKNLTGQGWYDHEWTSHLAGPEALGWDWFSLHLDDGRKLMVFRMKTTNRPPYLTGSLIFASGEVVTLAPEDITLEPMNRIRLAAATVPTQWRLQLDTHHIDLSLEAFIADQWNPAQLPYYEGRVEVSGSHKGSGFMELTGGQE